MRIPLEYGDNFPVPAGWNPAEPWRFPQHEVLPKRQGFLSLALPWITLGLGVSLGILWMSWRMELTGYHTEKAGISAPAPRQEEVLRAPVGGTKQAAPARIRTGLA